MRINNWEYIFYLTELINTNWCTTLLPPFIPKIWGFIDKKWLSIYDSKYCPSLATTFFHLSGNCRIPSRKNDASFGAIHEAIHFFFQLPSIPIPCNGFTRFQQLIIHHTQLVPLNAEHNLGTVNIRSGRRHEGMSGHSSWFSAFGIIVVDPVFVASHNTM